MSSVVEEFEIDKNRYLYIYICMSYYTRLAEPLAETEQL